MFENSLLTEIVIVLAINGLLWLFIAVCPVIVIRRDVIALGRLRPLGLAFLNIIFVIPTHNDEFVLRHEFAHVRQQRLFSPLGLALIIMVHYGYLFCKYGNPQRVYRHSYLEIHANRLAADSSRPLPRHYIIEKKHKAA